MIANMKYELVRWFDIGVAIAWLWVQKPWRTYIKL